MQLFEQTNGCVIAENIKYLLFNTLQVFQALVDQNPPTNKETRRKACFFVCVSRLINQRVFLFDLPEQPFPMLF